jgi:hypothetical protein
VKVNKNLKIYVAFIFNKNILSLSFYKGIFTFIYFKLTQFFFKKNTSICVEIFSREQRYKPVRAVAVARDRTIQQRSTSSSSFFTEI